MDSPYKIKHWSPVKRVPIAYDVWYNPTEWEDIESEEQKCSSDFLYRTVKEKNFLFFKIVVRVWKREGAINHTPLSVLGVTAPLWGCTRKMRVCSVGKIKMIWKKR